MLIFVIWLLPTVTGHHTTHIAQPFSIGKIYCLLNFEKEGESERASERMKMKQKLHIYLCDEQWIEEWKMLRWYKNKVNTATMHLKAMIFFLLLFNNNNERREKQMKNEQFENRIANRLENHCK